MPIARMIITAAGLSSGYNYSTYRMTTVNALESRRGGIWSQRRSELLITILTTDPNSTVWIKRRISEDGLRDF